MGSADVSWPGDEDRKLYFGWGGSHQVLSLTIDRDIGT